MSGSDTRPGSGTQPPRHWWRRIGWLVLIWALSVGGVLLVAFLLKLAMRSVGVF